MQSFVVNEIRNARNEVIEVANQPMTKVTVQIPFEVNVNDIIRRAR